MVLLIISCLTDTPNRDEVQCKGITISGERCNRMTNNTNGFCWEHQDQAKENSKSDSI